MNKNRQRELAQLQYKRIVRAQRINRIKESKKPSKVLPGLVGFAAAQLSLSLLYQR